MWLPVAVVLASYYTTTMSKTAENGFITKASDILKDSPSYSKDNEDTNGNSRRRLESHFDEQEEQGCYHCNDPVSCCEDSLDVSCPNKPLGCEWTGTLTDVVEHMNYECQYLPVSLLLDENVDMPMIIMMRGYKQLKCKNERWYSPVFCTHA